MRRKKTVSEPGWLIWDGEDFPRELAPDSVVFYLSEHIYLDSDPEYRKSLATAIQLEGLSYSLGESFRLVEAGTVTRAGYRLSDEDLNLFLFCEDSDPELEFDATFIEVLPND